MTRSQTTVNSLGALLMSVFALQAGAQETGAARFETYNDGTVHDRQTRLVWAASDNGGNVDWAGAQAHCQALGAGWALPSKDELTTIYMADPAKGQDCIGRLTCHTTPLIDLSGLTPWTSQGNGPDEAWYVYLADGQAYAYKSSSTQGKRALCMRKA